jgi:hypothetical protein
LSVAHPCPAVTRQLQTEHWQLAPEARPVLAKIRKDVFDIAVPK